MFASGDIEWTLSLGADGEALGIISNVQSPFITLTLSRFQTAPAILQVKTAVGGVSKSSLNIVPHPTALGASYMNDSVLNSHPATQNNLPLEYGGTFGTIVTPSNGASGFDLANASADGLTVKRILSSADERLKVNGEFLNQEKIYTVEDPTTLDRDLVGSNNSVILHEVAVDALKVFKVNPANLQVDINGSSVDFSAAYSYRVNTVDYDTGNVAFGHNAPKVTLTHPSAGYSVTTSAGMESEVYDQYLVAHNGSQIDTGGGQIKVSMSKTELHDGEWATVTVSGIIPDTHTFGGASVELYGSLNRLFSNGTMLDKMVLTFHRPDRCFGNTPFSATFNVRNVSQSLAGRVGIIQAENWGIDIYAKLLLLQPVGPPITDISDNLLWLYLLPD